MYRSKFKIKFSGNTIANLQNKYLTRLLWKSRAGVKYNFPQTLDENLNLNYLTYLPCSWRIIRSLVQPGTFFGLATHTYYSLELSKKQKLMKWNHYLAKLQVKKDSRFFYGLVLSRRVNFLSTTVTLRNVFYNQIMEKTYPIFSIWNTLVGTLQKGTYKHFLATFLKNRKKKKNFYHIRNYPRAFGRITLN